MIENYFFRYQKGMNRKTSNQTLLNFSDGLGEYKEYIIKRNKAFNLFLSELPDYILAYYLTYIPLVHPDLHEAIDREITEKTLYQPYLLTNIVEQLKKKAYISYINRIPCGIEVSLEKKSIKFNRRVDLYIGIDNGDIVFHELPTTFRKEEGINPKYQESLSKLKCDIDTFKEENRLRFTFIK